MAYKSTLSSENIQEALDIIHSAVVIGGGILTLDNQSSSEQISSAIGGEDGFNRILERIRGGNIALGIKVDDTTDNGIIMASIVAPKAENKFTISYLYKGIHYSDEFSLSGSTFSLSQTTEGGGLDSIFQDIQTDSALLESGAVYPIYLTNEKYSEIADAVKNDKIIRLIFACGVFYSVSVLLQPSTASTFVSKIIFGRAFMTGDDLNNFIEAKGKSYTVTFSENNDEGHDEPIKAIVTTEPDINKEIIEEVFTGNITTHTHDTTYTAQELETDVWDGTTVSTSWSGSGTEEDPFLIQSCADYIYFLIGKIDATMSDGNFTSADMKYVKITKNLDFDNKEIPTVQLTTSDPDFYKYLRGYILLDGNGCVVKNFSVEMPSNLGDNYTAPIWYLPLMAPAFVHDINFVGIKWKIPLGSNEEVLSMLTYASFANVVFDLTIETTGEYSAITVLPVAYNYFSIPGTETEIPIAQVYQDYVAEKGCFFGIDIKTQSIPQNGLSVYIQCQNPISGYDMSLYNWEGGNFDGSSIGQNMTLVIEGDYGDFRLSTLSSGKFIHQSFGGDDTTVIDAEVISPEDLKSQSYINEINSSNPVLTLNPNYNLPLIASLQVSYNGYVKKSVFDALGVKVDDINKKILAFLDISSIRRLDENYSSEAISEFISWYNNAISNLNIPRYKVFHYVVEDDGLIPVSVTGDDPTYSFAWVNGGVHIYKYIRREGSTFTITVKTNDLIDKEEVLVKDNTLAYTPTADYHPATKKYVDDSLPKVDFVSITVTKLAGDSLKFRGFYENELVDIELPCTHTEESSESPYTSEYYEVEITESTNSTLFKILSTIQGLYHHRYSYPDSPVKTIQTRIKPEVFLDNYYPVHSVDGILFGIESSSSPGFYTFVRGADSSTGAAIKIKGMTIVLIGVKFTLRYFPNVKWNFN